MPIDYSKYPQNWKSEIRPAALARAGNKCQMCFVPNYKIILRGRLGGQEVYQDDDGAIFDAGTSELIGHDYIGEIEGAKDFIRVVLTIAHLDHNIENNTDENLMALCQKCHLTHDKALHRANARKTLEKKRGIVPLFT